MKVHGTTMAHMKWFGTKNSYAMVQRTAAKRHKVQVVRSLFQVSEFTMVYHLIHHMTGVCF